MARAVSLPGLKESWAQLTLLVGVAFISIYGASGLVSRVRVDPRAGRFEVLFDRAIHAPARGFTTLETRAIPAPRFAGGALSLTAESDAIRENVKFYEGVAEYRMHWHQFNEEAEALSARRTAVERPGWNQVPLPPEILGGFYEDGLCITHSGTRWQCLHREGDTLIVGEVLTDAGLSDTPFAPHHALQTGTKGWIAARSEYADGQRRGFVEGALIAVLPWGVWGAVRWWRNLDEREPG